MFRLLLLLLCFYCATAELSGRVRRDFNNKLHCPFTCSLYQNCKIQCKVFSDGNEFSRPLANLICPLCNEQDCDCDGT